MRIHSFLSGTLLFAVLASPVLLRAQFQAPTDEELKMTADPKAPGAAAVYLYSEEIANDSEHFQSYYERIKVLTEKGQELATVSIPYERGEVKVAKIEGRTIHSDGTVIPLTVKPEDLVDFKTKNFQEHTAVFTLPSVEVGSILEYRLRLTYSDEMALSPTWNIQQAYPVLKAHYVFHPHVPAGGYLTNGRGQRLSQLMWVVSPANTPIVVQNKKGAFTVDLTDIPPIPDDDWMPPLNTINWRVEFYYTYANTFDEYWSYEGRQFAEFFNDFTKQTDALKKAAAGMVSPGDSDEQKARKIYAAVMKLDDTDFSRVKSEEERKKEKLKDVLSADQVWKQQSATGNQLALLYVALVRIAGLKAWPIKVVDRDSAFFDQAHFEIDQLDDILAIVSVGGKEIFLDPGQKVCPFGSLAWKHTLASGLRFSDDSSTVVNTPAATFKENLIQRIADLTIDANGNVTGTVRYVMTGTDALHWRQVALQNDQDEVKKQFDDSMRDDLPQGVEASFDHFLGLDDYESNLMAIVKVSGNVGTATGKYFILPGLFFESRAKHPFVAQDKRTTPIDMHYPRMEQDDVVYHLPPGYTIESAPKGIEVSWPGSALLRISSAQTGDSVEVARAFGRNFALLDSKYYGDLHDFYSKLAAADQQPLVLVRAETGKGN